jgi:ppGpp synthetase/RelA/SpoT-type nucleotidyltranferase
MRSKYGHIAEEIRREIEDLLHGIGILCRVFARGKDSASLESKLSREQGKYRIDGRLIQDSIGIRVALYFPDDISIVKSILESRYECDKQSSTIDKPESDQFSVTRYNLIFRLKDESADNFLRIKGESPLDSTFEVQLRSILSEGWHEVEHDLRYKTKENWVGHDDLSRVLNGIVATLENSEWNMAKIFEELAYRHYKNKNWQGMLPNILRMRLKGNISEPVVTALNSDILVAKDLLRIDRANFLKHLSQARPKLPITPDNVIFFWNAVNQRHKCLLNIMPSIIEDAASYIKPTASR